jgi:rhodanese-related sulfurtransferase
LPREAAAKISRPLPVGKGDRHAIDHPVVDPDVDIEPIRVCLPGPCVKDHRSVSQWAAEYRGRSVVVVCQKGQKLSEGAAAWLQHEGISAETLEGGFEGWKKAGQTLVRTDQIPPRDGRGGPFG